MRGYLYIVVALAALIAGPAITLASAPPLAGDLVLVVSADKANRTLHITNAGGRLVGPEEAAFGSFAMSEDPEFVQKLKSSGFWLVFDGRQFARLCGVEL